MQYYEDRWTRAIYSRRDLQRMVETEEVPRTQVPRRFRALAPSCCQLLDEAETIAAAADQDCPLRPGTESAAGMLETAQSQMIPDGRQGMATPTEPQPRRSWQEELTATGDELVGRVKDLVEEGNVRRIIIKHDERTLLEIPLTLGVVGALLAPQVAALGALAALVTHCTLTVEREEPGPPDSGTTAGNELPPGGNSH